MAWALILIFFGHHLFSVIDPKNEYVVRLRVFRAMNCFVILLHAIDLIALRLHQDYGNFFANLGLTLIAVYASIYCYSVACFFSYKRFGDEKKVDGQTIYLENYSTRIINLIILVFFNFIALYCIIKIWGADSLLQTTGIMGIIVGFFALTANIWGPDIISGLTILNSQILEDGDVVVIDGHQDPYIINKVSFVYVILYDITNNHRTLIKNSRFLQSKIDNLSRIASTDGLRKSICYNIGYPDLSHSTPDERLQALKQFQTKVDRMFSKSYELALEQKDIKINPHKPFDWALTQTGDNALQYTLWIFLERLPGTKVTATVRKHLTGTLFKVNEIIYQQSVAEGLSLATPALADVIYREAALTPEPNYSKDN